MSQCPPHTWTAGQPDGEHITMTCSACGATRTVEAAPVASFRSTLPPRPAYDPDHIITLRSMRRRIEGQR